MSHRLRLCSGAEAVKKFKRAGWTVDRQAGSHVMLVNRTTCTHYPFLNTKNWVLVY